MNNVIKNELHFSYSQLSSFLQCPLRYRFQYIDKCEPEHTASALLFGGAIHEAMAQYYRILKNTGIIPSLDEITKVFVSDWQLRLAGEQNVLYGKYESAESLQELGVRMLKTFYETVTPGEPLYIEQPFTLRKLDPANGKVFPRPIQGIVDLIERGPDGNVRIIDFKTAAKRYDNNRVHIDNQLSLYGSVLKRSSLVNGDTEVQVGFYVLTKTSTPTFMEYVSTRTEQDFHRLFKIMCKAIDAIEKQVFFPLENWQCASCPYQSYCLNW